MSKRPPLTSVNKKNIFKACVDKHPHPFNVKNSQSDQVTRENPVMIGE